ncbi:alpha/beta fold hydrolase [Micromonospora marina]|uniref:alpha/beta fold hydrolase n=1 Tax=Micromonospora marina TaxID=307120 RepID=UPI003451C54E
MNGQPAVILVPGAWSGAWVWEPTTEELRRRGLRAEAVTLRGLEADQPRSVIAAVHLEDHVEQVAALVTRRTDPVVLVGHSYSSMVTAQVADRLNRQVVGLIHFGGFMPTDGRSLLDDWSDSPSARDRERQEIVDAGDLWPPPEPRLLEQEWDLTETNRDFLARHFTLHPGRTVTDPARLNADTAVQPTTYVILSPEEISTASRATEAAAPTGWRVEHLVSGHWPMLSRPDEVVDLIVREVVRYGAGQG